MARLMRSRRTWIALAAVLAVALAAVALLAGGSEPVSASDKLEQRETVERVARRVEEIRGLRFKELPDVEVATSRELAEEAKRQAEEAEPAEKAAAEQAQREGAAALEAAKLAGMLPADFDPREAASTASSDVVGLYDAKANAVWLIRETVEGAPELAEGVLAHELTHALETQHFGSREATLRQGGERAYGLLSLAEGSATVVEYQYAKRHLGATQPLRDFLDRSNSDAGGGPLPQVVEDSIAFPYRHGGLFVDALVREAGGNSFELVDAAWRRPPRSSAEILHPELWRRNVKPKRVALGTERPLRDGGWRRAGADDFGEFDTASLLQLGTTRDLARQAAEGWAGGRFELWERGDGSCAPPCRDQHALTIGWRWRDADEAAEQEKWVRPYVQRGLKPESSGDGVWKLRGGWVAYERDGRRTALAFAPDRALAEEQAAAATR